MSHHDDDRQVHSPLLRDSSEGVAVVNVSPATYMNMKFNKRKVAIEVT